MLKSQSTTTGNSRSDGELCRNACGFYGNKIWDGFCSKCYREVYQQAKQIQETYDEKSNTPTADSNSWTFSNFHDKRRTNINMRNPIGQMVRRAENLRSSSSSVISSITNDEQAFENEIANKYLDTMTTENARVDIKSHVKTFANNFHKKCSNKTIRIDALVQDYGTFKDTIKKRIQTNSIYRDENEDLIHHVRDYVEHIIFNKNYSLIFNRIAIECEEQDLSIQHRISTLHWVTPIMLDAFFNENSSFVRETIYKAINALIELDSKTTPQGKIDSIMECKFFIEEALRTTSEKTINADCFLPALIYVVLKAKPPRLHSNIQFLSNFSQPNGEQLYYLANLDSAVRFIELVQAEHLGLSSADFSLYMRGEPVLPSKFVSLFDYPLENDLNAQNIRKMFVKCHEIEHYSGKLDENFGNFNRNLKQSVTDINELLTDSFKTFPYFEQIPRILNDKNEDINNLDKLAIENENSSKSSQEEKKNEQ